MARSAQPCSARRRGRRYRYAGTLVLFVALVGGWSWFWHYAAGKAAVTIDAWRAREAKAGRIYTCGTQSRRRLSVPHRGRCDDVAALFRGSQPPLELKTPRILAAVQVYDPTLMIAEFTGPLTIAEPGHAPTMTATWRLMQSSVRGTPPSRSGCRSYSTIPISTASPTASGKIC